MNRTTATSLHLLFGLLLSAPLAAQSTTAGSESYVAVVRVTAMAGDDGTSESFDARMDAGLHSSVQESTSSSYALWAGLAGIEPGFATGGPLVFGTAPPRGDKAGGDAVSVLGFNLDDGTSTATVLFGGSAATGVTLASNAEIQLTTPAGANPFGNPLGATAVTVVNGLGTGIGADAFLYIPAVVQVSPARIDEELRLDAHVPVGGFWLLGVGGHPPGYAVPVPGLDGMLELTAPTQLTPILPAVSDPEVFTVVVPDLPGLAGTTVHFQGAAVSSVAPFQGVITNRLEVAILP